MTIFNNIPEYLEMECVECNSCGSHYNGSDNNMYGYFNCCYDCGENRNEDECILREEEVQESWKKKFNDVMSELNVEAHISWEESTSLIFQINDSNIQAFYENMFEEDIESYHERMAEEDWKYPDEKAYNWNDEAEPHWI